MALIDGLLQELEQETETTRRVLERVPTSADLASARKGANAWGTRAACRDGAWRGRRARGLALSGSAPQFSDPSPKSASELIPALDQSIAKAKQALGGMDDAALDGDVAADAG